MMDIFQYIGDALHLGSIFLLLWKILSTKRVSGLSLNSQILYAVVFLARYHDFLYTWVSWYHTVIKAFFIVSSLHICYLMMRTFRQTYDRTNDSFRVRYLVGLAAVMAILFHKEFSVHGILWALSQWLEMVAIYPQLHMLSRAGSAEVITVQYLVMLGGYRLFYILHWINRWYFHGTWNWINCVAGTGQTVLYAEVFYSYFTSVVQGNRIALPS